MRTPARLAVSVAVTLACAGMLAAPVACTLTTSLDGLEGPPLTEDGGDGAPADARPADGSTGDASDAADAGPAGYPGVVLADRPLLYYRFGDTAAAATVEDSSGAGKNATLQGNTQPGVPGAIVGDVDTAFRFDGKSSVLRADGPSFAGTSSFTLEAWVMPTSFDTSTGGKVVMAKEQDSNDGYALFFYDNAKPRLERTFTDGNDTAAGTEISTTEYTHLVATYDGAHILLYVNGELVDAVGSVASVPGTQTSPFLIGSNGSPPINRFVGDIDEVAVYDHVLDETRVRLHYRTGKGIPAK